MEKRSLTHSRNSEKKVLFTTHGRKFVRKGLSETKITNKRIKPNLPTADTALKTEHGSKLSAALKTELLPRTKIEITENSAGKAEHVKR